MSNIEISEITSTQNEIVKFCVKLQNSKFRKQNKLILVDGIKTIEGLIKEGIEFEYFFCQKENFENKKCNIKKLIYTTDSILSKISSTKSYSKYVAIIKEPEVNFSIFKSLNKIALIDGIKDAGNLGTIIRSACAFGIDGIILFNDCVDLYNPKVIRSSTQNMFKIPIYTTSDINLIKELKQTHKLISTVVDSKKDLLDIKYDKNFIISFGSEANGLSNNIREISDEMVTIPMDKDVESLNLAICASVTFSLIKSYQRLIK